MRLSQNVALSRFAGLDTSCLKFQGRRRRIEPINSLPVHPQRELNDPRVVCLAAQVLQPRGGVGGVIVGVIEGVEEIRRESYVRSLFDLEVLEDREVRIPGAGTDNAGSRTGIVDVIIKLAPLWPLSLCR